MEPVVSKGKSTVSARQWLLQFVAYCRINIRAIATAAALVVVISELGGIWHEVHQI